MKPVSARISALSQVWTCLVALSTTLVPAGVWATEPALPSELHCVVMPSAVVDVSSGVSGRVETIDVERGDTVQAGQIVAALESGVEQANLALAQRRADLDTDISLRKARLAFEVRKRERTNKLHTSQVVSVHEQDEVQTDARLASWQLRQAIDEQTLARLERERAAELLKRRSARSPIDGVVVERFKWPGEYVEEEPILRVARLDPLWVEVVAPVALHDAISKGMLAEVMPETEPGVAREARVIVVDPMGDAASGTFRVRLELPNPDLNLLGGIKCKARFPKPARYAPEVAKSPESPHETMQMAVVQDTAVQRNPQGYIVLTPLASHSENDQLASVLRDAGVSDFMVMGSGPYAGRISLGTYNGRRMAERRKSQLSTLGVETDVVLRSSIKSRPPTAQAQAEAEQQQQREAALIRSSAGPSDERG